MGQRRSWKRSVLGGSNKTAVPPAARSHRRGFEPERALAVESAVANHRKGGDVFLLGAGFARAISPTMPLLQDLATRVRRAWPNARRLPVEVRGMMNENFAHALSYLEQAKPWVTEAENLRHRALFLEISDAIANDLEGAVSRAGKTLAEQAPAWLRDLVRHWHGQRSTVITLNYDTLVESVAAHIEVDDGPGIETRQLYPLVLTDAAFRSGAAPRGPRGESFRLLKLHGSTNWFYSGRALSHGEPIYFVPPLRSPDDRSARAEHEDRLRAVADKYPFLVPPIYDKSPLLTHETIRALWFEAGDALQHAERIVCLGYSLPESDLTMKHFLRTTCSGRARFEIVNPATRARANFQRLFRGTNVQVEQRVRGRRCIETFVRRGINVAHRRAV